MLSASVISCPRLDSYLCSVHAGTIERVRDSATQRACHLTADGRSLCNLCCRVLACHLAELDAAVVGRGDRLVVATSATTAAIVRAAARAIAGLHQL